MRNRRHLEKNRGRCLSQHRSRRNEMPCFCPRNYANFGVDAPATVGAGMSQYLAACCNASRCALSDISA